MLCVLAVQFLVVACGNQAGLGSPESSSPAPEAGLPSPTDTDEKVSYATSDWDGVVDGVAPESPVDDVTPVVADDPNMLAQALTSSPTTGWLAVPSGTRRISIPKGKTGPPSSGAAFVTGIGGSKRYRIKYEVMPEGNFDFRAGGKLPGLGGGSCPAGGSSATDGYSARLMWNQGGRLSFYFYRVYGGTGGIDTGGYGTHWMWAADAKLIPGRWNTIEVLVDMTTGETVGYLNGVEKARQKLTYQWSTTDKMVFSAFFGGQGYQYAPSKNEYLSFRNMQIRPGW